MGSFKVSVVIPVYNVEAYIEECVRSILKQTLEDIEIILVDDGSTDNSGIICDRYANENEHVRVIHKINGGLGSARNVGLENATGKYVYFIDSDDSLKTDALEILYKIANCDNLDVLMFSATCFSDAIGISYNANEYKRTKYLNVVKSGKELFLNLLDEREYYASIPLRLYRTEYLKAKDYSFPEHIIHEDEIYAYWSLIQADRAECISDRFYNRRFRAGSIMTSKRAYDSAVGYVYTWKKIVDTMDELAGWSDAEINQVISFAYLRIGIALNYYALRFDRGDIRRFKSQISDISKSVNNNPKVKSSSRRLKLLCINPFVFRSYIKFCNYKNNWRQLHNQKRKKADFSHAINKIKTCRSENKLCVILIGTPIHGNLGDQAIVLAEHRMLNSILPQKEMIEIYSKDYLEHADELQQVISENDIIIIDGGGSMGTLWVNNEYRFRDVIRRFPNNRIYIFPQTVYYGNDEWEQKVLDESRKTFSMHKRLTIFCRDSLSYNFTLENFSKNEVLLAPDMVLSLYPQKQATMRGNKVLLCLREDVEAALCVEEKTDLWAKVSGLGYEIETCSTIIDDNVDKDSRELVVSQKWLEFSQARLIVTDRLHAMIFCALTGTPCVAIDNRSGKVAGAYEWIKELTYISLLKSLEQADKQYFMRIISEADKFVKLNQVDQYFEEMQGLIKENERK